jgi:Na+/proline symporter
MDNRELLIGLTFVVYLLVILVIGVIAWRRTRNLADA